MINKESVLEELVAIEQFVKDIKEYIGAGVNVVSDSVEAEAPKVIEEKPIKEAEEVVPEASSNKDEIEKVIKDFELEGWNKEDLIECLDSYEISYGKSLTIKEMREAVAQAVLDGKIPYEDDGVEKEPEVVADEPEPSYNDERSKMEATVEKEIKENYESKKLKDTVIKKFLKEYYEGDPDCKDCSVGCTKEEALQCYIDLKKNFVDDEGDVHAESEPYYRDNEVFCCGHECSKLDNGNLYCEICGEEYLSQ